MTNAHPPDVARITVVRLRLLSRRSEATIAKWLANPDAVLATVDHELRAACVALGVTLPRERQQ